VSTKGERRKRSTQGYDHNIPALADFRTALDTPFRVQGGEVLRLVEAEATGGYAAGMGRDPFRLAFLGPADPVLPQRTYRLEHGTLGALDIFLVPIASDASGTTYEAIFA
jgi:hypothetical protein